VKLPNSRQAFSDVRTICLSCLLLSAAPAWASEPNAESTPTDPPINAQADEFPLLEETDAAAQAGSVPIVPIHIGNPLVVNQLGEVTGSTMRAPLSTASTQVQLENTVTMGPPDEETFLSLAGDIRRYEEMLDAEEELRGAWDPTLSEDLMAMGRMLQEQGDFYRALEIFTRAAHINRINYGLVSVEQVAPIESMVETHIALNQWQEADRQQRYAFYVQSRAYKQNDPRLIPALDKLAQWNIMTFRQGTEGEPLLKLLEAYRLYNAAAALVTVHFGSNDPRYVNYLKNMTQTAFRLALYGTQSEIDRVSLRHHTELAGPSVLTTSNGMVNNTTRISGFSEGEQALRNIYELYSSSRMRNLEGIELRRAQALAELGDWYMVFNRRQSAFRIYRDVYDILSEAEPGEKEQFFEQLVALPGFLMEEDTGLNLTDGSGQPLRQGYVDVSLNINQYGRATNAQSLVVEPPDASRASSEVVRTARGMNFRPRLEGRDTIEVKEVRLRFPFWY
jgi:tetratricopeptide (TPR) repeat protein